MLAMVELKRYAVCHAASGENTPKEREWLTKAGFIPLWEYWLCSMWHCLVVRTTPNSDIVSQYPIL
jgi:hypothetical protein